MLRRCSSTVCLCRRVITMVPVAFSECLCHERLRQAGDIMMPLEKSTWQRRVKNMNWLIVRADTDCLLSTVIWPWHVEICLDIYRSVENNGVTQWSEWKTKGATGESTHHSNASELKTFLIIKQSNNFQSVRPDGELCGSSPLLFFLWMQQSEREQ